MMASNEEAKDDGEDSKLSDTRGETPSPVNMFQVMNSYAREFIFVLAVMFTAIAALQNGPLKSRKANPPEPFFPEPTLVTDFYQGDFSRLTSLVLEKDVSMVMYYAPWDAKSMHRRNEFEIVAKFYHQEVFFAAMNCWWPEGECNRKYKIYSYPVVVAYVHGIGGVRYDGPLVSNYMIAFLDHILSPIATLWHTHELLDLQTKHEGVLIAHFNFKNSFEPQGYQQYYAASLEALTKDPNRRLCFTVITNEHVASKFKLKSPLQLYFWNGTESYTEKSWKSTDLLKWAYSKLNQVVQWVTPPGSKSKMLSSVFEKAAVLIMFTPRNLLLESTPYFDLLREVAMDYNNCNGSSHVISLVHRIVLKRHILQEEFTKLIEKCQLSSSAEENICRKNLNSCALTCCQLRQLTLSPKALNCFCRVCLHHAVESLSKMKLSECENTLDLVLKSFKASMLGAHDHCGDVELSYPTKFGSYQRLSFKCHSEFENEYLKHMQKSNPDVEHSDIVKDDRILEMIEKTGKVQCSRLKLALNYSKLDFPEFPPFTDGVWQANFSGLQCQTNRTLLFIVMDTLQFHTFAEKLGIDVLNKLHQTAVVIVESKHESMYVLEEHINKRTLVEFIKNYSSRTLDRFLRSAVHKLEGCGVREGSICVKELTTSTFLDYVLKNDTDVVLMYYAAWCGACSSISHIFLAIANYFANVEKVKFARISGDDHDLPWEYTVEKYPTIIFFPAFRKADSVEFPSKLPITSTNLLHFILVNSQPKVRRMVSIQMCNRDCVANNLAKSSTEILRLFRDYRILLNQLQFLWQIIGSRLNWAAETPAQAPSQEDLLIKHEISSYMQHLVSRIRNKKSKIEQAYQLQELLQKKRDQYLNQHEQNNKVSSSVRDTNKNSNQFILNVPTQVSKAQLSSSDITKDEL